jgi:hypothetical protein
VETEGEKRRGGEEETKTGERFVLLFSPLCPG